jgi:L-lactate dehydrogenase (cytochrome)
MGAGTIGWEELQRHNTKEDCWVVVGSTVYDLSGFASQHPGGQKFIHKYAGRIATTEFTSNHPESIIAQTLPNRGRDLAVGEVDLGTMPPEASEPNEGFADSHAAPVVADPDSLPRIEECVNLYDYELVAQKKMAMEGREKGLAYYSSGGDDETTMRDNMSAFHRIWLRPRVLRDVSHIDSSSTILGYTQPGGEPFTFPVYLSSVALQKLGHPDGELAWIRACVAQGVNYLLPTLSSCSYEEMYAEANSFGMNFMFQLYVNQDRELVREMVQNAERAGCRALFVTVDAPQLGRRDKDLRMKTVSNDSVATVQSKQGKNVKQDSGTAAAISTFIDPSLSWKDIEWMMSITSMDIMLKGIQCADDALLAKRMGVKGIVVSNHGGRQMDTARSGIEILPEVTDALRSEYSEAELEDFHIVLDGGVRRGTDIFKALALGARAVGIGKPAAYAMSAYGQAGIEQMLSGLRAEFRNVMQLMGVSSVEQIRREGRAMCDIASLAQHVQPSPFDYLYQPVNVLTHGTPRTETARHWLQPPAVGGGGSSSSDISTVTTTTTTSQTLPDGTVTTTSTTTTAPVGHRDPAQLAAAAAASTAAAAAAADHVLLQVELHDYHEDFLAEKTAQYGLMNGDAVLRCLVNFAAEHPGEWEAIFRTVHCHRCDKEEEGQQNASKKSKKPVAVTLHPAHRAFLADRVANIEGAHIEAVGPVHRAVKDLDKAVRVIMDWAITQEHSGAAHLPQVAQYPMGSVFGTEISQVAALSKVSGGLGGAEQGSFAGLFRRAPDSKGLAKL